MARKEMIYADGSCIHGILIQDVCFTCEIRLVAEEDRKAKNRAALTQINRLNAKYPRR